MKNEETTGSGFVPRGKFLHLSFFIPHFPFYGFKKFSRTLCIFSKSGRFTYIMWPASNVA